MENKNKIISDPIYGFITIPTATCFDIIQHPYFQRLRRIKQLGSTELVYPGATHTRFHHAIGAMHLMMRALEVLERKGILTSEEEKNAAYCAILLHDIGHGPYSHTLEHTLVKGIGHEEIGLLMMQEMNKTFSGKLDLAIKIFKNQYGDKPFIYQLISSQLDMDRLDYLQRDSFYTGVSEGIVGADRIINMLHVYEGNLVIEEKGILSVEKFLVARRIMYWQVYLHKTSVAADNLLLNILKRARFLAEGGNSLGMYNPLIHFLGKSIKPGEVDVETLQLYSMLDDSDIIAALKVWLNHEDIILRTLCTKMLNRLLPKIEIRSTNFSEIEIMSRKHQAMIKYGLESIEETDYFVSYGSLENKLRKGEEREIGILRRDGGVEGFSGRGLWDMPDMEVRWFLGWG